MPYKYEKVQNKLKSFVIYILYKIFLYVQA